MKKISSPAILLLAIAVITAVAFAIFWFYRHAPADSTKTAAPDPARLFEQSIDCAALMAAMESSLHGKLAPNSPALSLVGYTLGYAKEQAQKAGLDPAGVRPAYDLKVISYYQKFLRDPEAARARYREAHDHCVTTARHYDPHTMLQAAFEDAQKRQDGQQP